MNRFKPLSAAILTLIAAFASSSCDMVYIPLDAPPAPIVITEYERDLLERTGHFLKLTYMPLYTQAANVMSVQIANSASAIATLDKNNSVKIFKETGQSTVYLPLVYNNNSEFTETGSFYSAFTILVDAVTDYAVSLSDKILVPFADGRGTLDIRSLPEVTPTPVVITEDERDLLERTGRFLKLTNMPLNTQAANVLSVQIANSVSAVATLDKNNSVKVFMETPYSTAYLPLVCSDNSEFTETGRFYAAFTIHIDAVTGYVLSLNDKFLVSFTNGRGTLDIRTLPPAPPPPAVITEDERDLLERTGRFLKLTHMPLNTQAANVLSVQIANSVSTVATLDKNNSAKIFMETPYSTVYLPLAYANNSEFTETGSFYAAFTIHVDAVTSYAVSLSDKILVPFADGRGTLDIRTLPASPPPPDPDGPPAILTENERDLLERTGHFLKLTHMPLNTQAANVMSVQIANSVSAVA
jgi:hypothetical protein